MNTGLLCDDKDEMGACCSQEEDEFTGVNKPRDKRWRVAHGRVIAIRGGGARGRDNEKRAMISRRKHDVSVISDYLREMRRAEPAADDIDAICNAFARLETKEEQGEPDKERVQKLSRLPLPQLEIIVATASWDFFALEEILRHPPVPRKPYRIICSQKRPYQIEELLNQKYRVNGKEWIQRRVPREGSMAKIVRNPDEPVEDDPMHLAMVAYDNLDARQLLFRGQAFIVSNLFATLSRYEKSCIVFPFASIADAETFFRSSARDSDYTASSHTMYGQQKFCLVWAVLTRYADLVVDDSTLDQLEQRWRPSPFAAAMSEFADVAREFEENRGRAAWQEALAARDAIANRAAAILESKGIASGINAYTIDLGGRERDAPIVNGQVRVDRIRPSDDAMPIYRTALELNREESE